MELKERVIDVTEIHWSFEDNPPIQFTGMAGGIGFRNRNVVDPTPAYAHPRKRVISDLADLEARLQAFGMELTYKPFVYLLHYESTSRTNGWAGRDFEWGNKEDDKPWEGEIVLNAKRTPLLPEATRYYLAHEYGHHCAYHAQRHYGFDDDDRDDLYRKYASMRRLGSEALKSPYAPGFHHLHVNEVMANDARILLLAEHGDFWPHPYKHPLELATPIRDKLILWWSEALKASIAPKGPEFDVPEMLS